MWMGHLRAGNGTTVDSNLPVESYFRLRMCWKEKERDTQTWRTEETPPLTITETHYRGGSSLGPWMPSSIVEWVSSKVSWCPEDVVEVYCRCCKFSHNLRASRQPIIWHHYYSLVSNWWSLKTFEGSGLWLEKSEKCVPWKAHFLNSRTNYNTRIISSCFDFTLSGSIRDRFNTNLAKVCYPFPVRDNS